MCIDKLDDLVNEYNNTYSTTKMEPANINPSMYIDFGVQKKLIKIVNLKLLIM